MAGNKHDNGVHEIGTPETLKAYQEDTPGQEVEKYLAGIQEVIQEKKEKQKKSFMQVFQNPLKGFPYNEELEDNLVKPIGESVELEEGRLSDLLIDIQQGATAKELAKTWKIPLSVAKDFLADYYADNRSRRPKREEVEIEESRPRVGQSMDVRKRYRGKEQKSVDKMIMHSGVDKVQKLFLDEPKEFDALVKRLAKLESVELEEAKNLMPEIQKIVDTKGAKKVGGIMIDMFTASMINQIYNKVNDSNKKKMEKSNISTLVDIAQRIMQKSENDPIEENYKDVIKMYPRDRDWKKLITKHRKNIDDFRNGKKDLDKKVEDELISWALDAGEIRNKGEVEDFIDDILNEETVQESNGMVGKKIRNTYRPARAVRGKPFSGKLTSHSTIEKSDLFKDVEKNAFDLADDCNSIAIRVPSPRGSEKDKEKWRELVNSSFDNGGQPAGLIRGGGLAPSEVKELFADMKKAASAFGSRDILAQSHEISINNKKGKLNIDKGLNAMLKAIDEFGMRNHVSVSGRDGILTQIQYAANHLNEEVKSLQEGTWQIPDSYDKLLDLQKFLSKPHKAKTAREVHKFHIDADRYFGDDSFSDMLDSYYHTLPGGDIDPYDKKEKVSPKSIERAKKYNKIKPGTDLNILLMKALTDWTGGDLQFDRRGKITQMPRKWYETNNPKLNNKSNVVKATLEQKEVVQGTLEEGKMDGQKLTGQEISVYFRRNKVRDKTVRKAVEIALDHGGAMNYAIKKIEKLKRGLSKNKDVEKALNYANFGEQYRLKGATIDFKTEDLGLQEDPYTPFKTGSGKLNKNIEKYWKKEIRGISKDELLKIQSMYMITDHSGVVAMYKAGKRDFLKSLKD